MISLLGQNMPEIGTARFSADRRNLLTLSSCGLETKSSLPRDVRQVGTRLSLDGLKNRHPT